jgi:hypothetical protein
MGQARRWVDGEDTKGLWRFGVLAGLLCDDGREAQHVVPVFAAGTPHRPGVDGVYKVTHEDWWSCDVCGEAGVKAAGPEGYCNAHRGWPRSYERVRHHFESYDGFDTHPKRSELTCDQCKAADGCPFVWDAYNTNGDCLREK